MDIDADQERVAVQEEEQEQEIFAKAPKTHEDWALWEDSCKSCGVRPPGEDELVFMPIVRKRFPTITTRAWNSKFGCSEEVLETMWRRYFFKFFYFEVEPIWVLWKLNKLSTNETWDDLATNWASSRTKVYNSAQYAGQVLANVLDEVRHLYGCFTSIYHKILSNQLIFNR